MTPDDFPKSVKDFFAFAKKNQAEMVDLKFVDMLGSWQHCSFPIDTLDEGTFEEGLGFDGSSIRGWMGIHESDMMALPDPATARLDPFFARPTVSVIANVVDPISRKEFTRDPRHVARKAEEYLKQSGMQTRASSGPSRSSSSLTRFATSRTSTAAITRSIRSKARGTRRASRSRTLGTSRASRAATFPSARPTRSTICAARWSTRCARSESSSKRTITRSPPRDNPKST
jgi:glutamine synthetase